MPTVDELVVRITADATDLKKQLKKVEGDAGKTGKKLGKAFDSFNKSLLSSGKNIAKWGGLLGAGAAVGAAAFLKSLIDNNDKLGKLNTRLGISVEALSEYQHVAKLSGVTFETFTMGLQRMTRRVAEAAQGTGEAKNALKEMNLNAAELSAMSPDQQFETIADSLNGLTSEADKVRLAMKLFDSEGVSLIQTMSGGSAGIRQMREEARALGLTVTDEAARAAEKFNDDLARTSAAATGAAQALLTHMMPGMTRIAEAMAIAAREAGILEAVWVGLGGVAAEVFLDSDEQNRIDDMTAGIEDLQYKIRAYQNQLKETEDDGFLSGIFGTSDPDDTRQKMVLLEAQLKRSTAELAAYQKQLAAPPPPKIAPPPVVETGGGGDPLVTDAAQRAADAKEKEEAAQRAKFEALNQGFMGELELLNIQEQMKLEQLTIWRETNIVSEMEYEATRTAVAQEAADARTAIAIAKQKEEEKTIKKGMKVGESLAIGGAKAAKKILINSIAEQAQAWTVKAVAGAFADTPGDIFVKTAAGVAAGAFIQTAVSSLGGGGGGGGGGGEASAGGGASAGTPITPPQQELTQADTQPTMVFNFNEGDLDSPGALRAFVDKLNEAQLQGVVINS